MDWVIHLFFPTVPVPSHKASDLIPCTSSYAQHKMGNKGFSLKVDLKDKVCLTAQNQFTWIWPFYSLCTDTLRIRVNKSSLIFNIVVAEKPVFQRGMDVRKCSQMWL